jgi:hypothetical protein
VVETDHWQDAKLTHRDKCTPWSVLGGNETLLDMPQKLWNLTVPINKIDNVIPGEYQLANGILHAVGELPCMNTPQPP